jgi:hypothetical protein
MRSRNILGAILSMGPVAVSDRREDPMRHAGWAIALMMFVFAGCARLPGMAAYPANGSASLRPNAGESGTRDSSGVHIPRSPAMRPHVPW